MDLSNKKVLVIDFGLFSEIAARLARDCGHVYYFVPWQDAFPKMSKALIGQNFKEIDRVMEYEPLLDSVDLIVFPDTHSGAHVEFLRSHGYPVAGVGQAEELELDRWEMRQIQKEIGLPSQDTELITGIVNLFEYLSEVKHKFVKMNIFRGDIESFYHSDIESSIPLLNHLRYDLGPKADEVEFVVEDEVKGCEPGLDCIIWDSQVLSPTMYGFEKKGAGYIGRVCDIKDIPPQLKMVQDKLAPIFKAYRYRFFFSSEVICPNKTDGYLIDPCCRFAAPAVSAIQTELIENFSEVMFSFAGEQPVMPIMRHKYGAGIVLYSDWANANWLNVQIPKELSRWIKFRMASCFESDSGNMEYWAVPGHTTIATAVGLADTYEEAASIAVERSKEVKGYQIQGGEEDIKKVLNAIEDGKRYGIRL